MLKRKGVSLLSLHRTRAAQGHKTPARARTLYGQLQNLNQRLPSLIRHLEQAKRRA